MSKEIEWGALYGEGTIVATCDQCGNELDAYDFEDCDVDYGEAQTALHIEGWVSQKIGKRWYDFCCRDCRDKFLAKRVPNV